MKKLLITSALAFFAITSAHAQTKVPTNFYLVQDTSTKKCTVVDAKPTSTTMTVVDNGEFPTKEQAEQAIKTMKICN